VTKKVIERLWYSTELGDCCELRRFVPSADICPYLLAFEPSSSYRRDDPMGDVFYKRRISMVRERLEASRHA
jgi:hypothetical protein